MKSKHLPATNFNIQQYLATLSPQELERIATHALTQAQRRTKSPRVPDKVNSSYWWELYMNPGEKVSKITGYSKFEGFNEARNTDDCLAGKIEMLYKNGYFQKTYLMLIYKRIGAICNIEVDQLLLKITPDSWEYMGQSPNIEKFITNFRNRIENGIAPKVHLRPIIKRS